MTTPVNHNSAVSTVNTANAPAATAPKKQNVFAKVASDLAKKFGLASVSRAALRYGLPLVTRIVGIGALGALPSLALIAGLVITRQVIKNSPAPQEKQADVTPVIQTPSLVAPLVG